MTRTLLILLFILLPGLLPAQQNVDSLRAHLAAASDAMKLYHAYDDLYNFYEETNKDSALYYAELELSLCRRNNKKLTEVLSLNHKGYQIIFLGRYAEALKCLQQAFDIAENKKNKEENPWIPDDTSFSGDNRLLMLAYTHHVFGILMWQTGNTAQEIVHFKEAREIAKEIGNTNRQQLAAMNLGRSYTTLNKLDSALVFETEAGQLVAKTGPKKYLGMIYSYMGSIYTRKGDTVKAKEYYYRGIKASTEQKNMVALDRNYFMLTKSCIAEDEKDSAIFYALKTLKTFQSLGVGQGGTTANLGTIYQNIYLSYQLNNQVDSAYKYQGLALRAIDSLSQNRIKNLTDFQNAGFNEQLRLQNVEKEKVAYQNKVKTYFFLGGIAMLMLLVVIFYRNSRQKHKAKQKIEKAYKELKATQQQLIQSEKMASLGELTAGIAHEIQNPLNFVNNFSEVNRELIDELKGERQKAEGERNKELEDEILIDIGQNLEKISFHGKRADGIVKGMLQHSRASSGQKELTDINKLADEYLRLSYHGMRAKDKSFNAEYKTDFDETIGKINVVPQDIGRVLLNIINNAFYAVNEKQMVEGEGFKAMVSIQTKKLNEKIEIVVKDNANGIPQNLVDKIFHPFFTTKPTGQGTGLGLSLAYDISKAHGGEIKVDTKEGEGSEFIITLRV